MRLIKIIHSLIWIIMVLAIAYILYAGITNTINIYLWISLGLMALELLVLAINKGSCPLTIVAKRSTDDYHDGDDIFLPTWLAVNNKLIFGSILCVALAILAYRFITN